VADGTINITVNAGGVSKRASITVTDETAVQVSGTLAAGKAGTLSTRTDNDTGVVTLAAGHGLSSATYDVHWTESGVLKSRRGMAGTLSVNDMTLDGGAGENLPAEDAAVVICTQSTFEFDHAGDNLKLLFVHASARAGLDFEADDGTSHLALDVAANEGYLWWDDGNVTNPVAGDTIGKIVASSGSTTAAVLTVMAILTSQS
jgi:hypothetical protein